MTPQRREVIGAAIVVGLALGGVSLAGLALAAVVIRAVPLQGAGQQPGGEQADGEPRPGGHLQAVTLGGQVFRQRCARCHGAGGQGKGSGPPLAGVGLSREEVEAAVREGVPPLMPAFGRRLRDEQIRAVADYVASLNPASRDGKAAGGEATGAAVPGRAGDGPTEGNGAATSGRLLFRRQCASCHGAQAEGRGAAPPLANAGLSREEIDAAVREGVPPLMPAFANRLRPDQVQAVTDYVASFNRGPVSDQPAGPGVTRQWGTSRARMRGNGCPMMGPRR
jgi:cytochrome c oxidase cbb3-type subunit 3